MPKHIFRLSLLALFPLLYTPVFATKAKWQRLSILPQSVVIQPQDANKIIKSLCIDFDRSAPGESMFAALPDYNQVYGSAGVSIKINGKTSDKTLAQLVQSSVPLLRLRPVSNYEIQLSINPEYKEMDIQSIEIQFTQPVEIGYLPDDNDLQLAHSIYNTWGYDIGQDQYWAHAKCLLVLDKNRALTINGKALSEAEIEKFRTVYTQFDFVNVHNKLFSYLLAENYFALDNNLRLGSLNLQWINEWVEYYETMNMSSEKNNVLMVYPLGMRNGKDTAFVLQEEQKRFEASPYKLLSLGKSNPNVKDTLIEGQRHILMVAFKKVDFSYQYIQENKYSSKSIMDASIFLVAQHELADWAKQNKLQDYSEPACQKRLLQLLGLPPSSTNNTFIEFWVNENDIFRPAIDSSLNSVHKNSPVDITYARIYLKYLRGSYENIGIPAWLYPFTGLGYTWDCHPQSSNHIGLNEFVLKPGKTIRVRQKIPMKKYITSITK